MAQLPALAGLGDQARLDLVLGCEIEEFLLAQKCLESGDRLANQERLFVPVTLQEGCGRELAE